MRMPLKIMTMIVALSLTAACAPPPPGAPPNYYTTGGALMGAAAGAAVGHAIDPTGGALTGALGGALIGGTVGNQMDYQNQQIYSQQRQIRRMRRNGYYDYGPPRGYYYNPPPY